MADHDASTKLGIEWMAENRRLREALDKARTQRDAMAAEERRAFDAGQFRGHVWDQRFDGLIDSPDVIVIEKPVAHGATRPQVVECAWVAGWLEGALAREGKAVCNLTRREVCKTLTDACSLPTEDRVRNDATAWAALVLLHGEGSDKKARTRKGEIVEPAGAIGGVTSHERAALAVAVAWAIREGVTCS